MRLVPYKANCTFRPTNIGVFLDCIL